jgi:hypothetical protein
MLFQLALYSSGLFKAIGDKQQPLPLLDDLKTVTNSTGLYFAQLICAVHLRSSGSITCTVELMPARKPASY